MLNQILKNFLLHQADPGYQKLRVMGMRHLLSSRLIFCSLLQDANVYFPLSLLFSERSRVENYTVILKVELYLFLLAREFVFLRLSKLFDKEGIYTALCLQVARPW